MTQSTTKGQFRQQHRNIANTGQCSQWIYYRNFTLHDLLKCTSSTPQMLIKLSFFLGILFFCCSFISLETMKSQSTPLIQDAEIPLSPAELEVCCRMHGLDGGKLIRGKLHRCFEDSTSKRANM